MAVAYASIATASKLTGGGAETLTITKPSGLASGDMMVAIFNAYGNSNDATLTGWTEIIGVGSGTSYRGTVLIKVADSGDAAASDFTFNAGSATAGNPVLGALLRLTGTSFTGTANFQSTQDANTTPATDHVFTPGITPISTSDVFIMAILSEAILATSSTYAITNNNPTWTERADFSENGTGSTDASLAVATATVGAASATGDFSATISSSAEAIGILLSLTETASTSVSPSVITMTGTVRDSTNGTLFSVTAGSSVTAGVIDMTASVQDPTVTAGTAKWVTENKSNTSPTITNETKS